MPQQLTIEGNSMFSTAGIYVNADGTAPSKLSVRYNKALNIDGRLSDGTGGYLATTSTSNPIDLRQFVQLNQVRATPNVEIAWNEVINEPGNSFVADNISLFLSSGTANSPILVHDNYIQGAYPVDPVTDTDYTGGGIIVDGSADSVANASGFIRIVNNQVVSTTNYGLAIAAGHDVQISGNRAISSGLTPHGARIAAANVGLYVWDAYGDAKLGTFFADANSANSVAWVKNSGKRNDDWFPNCTVGECATNVSLLIHPTTADEANEYVAWTAKLAQNGLSIGSTLPVP
jgi:hypothetical protein